MDFKKKIITQFLIMLSTITIILVLTMSIISPISLAIAHAIFKVPFGSSFLFDSLSFIIPMIIAFLVICLYYGKRMADVLFYFLEWIELLSNGAYEIPKFKNKKGKTPRSINLYKELEGKLEKLTNRLRENQIERQKIDQTRKDWTSGVTHDLKTPLSYIQGYSTMMLTQKEMYSDQEKNEFLSIILEKSIHMKDLIDDLSDTYQFEKGKISFSPERNNIIRFTKKVVEEIKKQPSALEYVFTFKSNFDELDYSFDAVLLKRALNNLLINAINHNPPKTIVTTLVYIDDTSKSLVIEVEDNGVGMSSEEQENLFNRYYRGTSTSTLKEGTGLGMAIAKQFIDIHQGTINVKSSPSKGTTIKIQFPL